MRDLLAQRAAAPDERGERPVAQVEVSAEHQVVDQGEVREQLDALEGAGHAERRDVVRSHADDLLAGEANAALLRPVDAGQDVEDGRLAGAVGTDDREQLARLDGERDTVDRDHAGEPQRHVADIEDRRAHAAHRFRRL